MPRGTCDKCGQHDVFVHATPVALGRNVFLCAPCLNPSQGWNDGEDNEESSDHITSLPEAGTSTFYG